jgi:DNA-binding response OmpR family regulator
MARSVDRRTILLLEDDHAVRGALQHVLKASSYHVVPAANRRQALDGLATQPIDLVLLDLNLGREGGWETFDQLRALRPLVPILVMSASPDQLRHDSAWSAAGLLEKPFSLTTLMQKLAVLLSHAGSHAARAS